MINLRIHDKLEWLYYAMRQRLGPNTISCFPRCRELLSGGVGLEIGGPSTIFSRNGRIPMYTVLQSIDNSNFSDTTIWGSADGGRVYQYDHEHQGGKYYVQEATDLHQIPAATYDCVLSSHVIEHVANPLKALHEWSRVLKELGILILVVPHKDGTFDHRRPVTTFGHLLDDYQAERTEADTTHLQEIFALHDLEKDPAAGSREAFQRRSGKNIENRALHHHVFDTRLVLQVVNSVRFQILDLATVLPMHIIVIAQKVSADRTLDNERFSHRLGKSPFGSDRGKPGV